MKFKSKIDAWLAVTLFGCALVSVWAAYFVATRAAGAGLVGAIVLLAIGGGLPLWLLLSTSYEIKGGNFHICCGPFRWNIPLTQVTSVTPSKSVISSPALSLDRLRVEYGQGKVVLVSPCDRASFLQALSKAGDAT
jgi:hypothetical protein